MSERGADAVAEIMDLVGDYGGECGDFAHSEYGTDQWKRAEASRKEGWDEVRTAVEALVRQIELQRPVVEAAVGVCADTSADPPLYALCEAVDAYVAKTAPPDGGKDAQS